MDTPDDAAALDALLLAVLRMVFKERPISEAIRLAGQTLGQLIGEYEDREEQEHQQPGEWRSYQVDGYRFSIKRDTNGKLKIIRELDDES